MKFRPKLLSKIKPSLVAVYVGLFAVIVALVYVGYSGPQSSSATSNDKNKSSTSNQVDQTSIDKVIATSVAASVAQTINLPIANNVANMAVSAQIKNELAQSNGVNMPKPQIIISSEENRLVTNYTAAAGDTVSLLAVKFHISEQSIKWANNLTTDAISVGKELRILPVDGVLYDIKAGDTFDSIATKYASDSNRIKTFNDLEISGLLPNTKIILPNATLPENERPGYVAPIVYTSWAGSGNGYAFGNCTYYAYNRRIQLGKSASSSWGNANTWDDAARGSQGFVVSQIPTVGAIAQWNSYSGGSGWAGHVGIVESVNSADNSITISEMNNYAYGGFNSIDYRNISSGDSGWPSNFISSAGDL